MLQTTNRCTIANFYNGYLADIDSAGMQYEVHDSSTLNPDISPSQVLHLIGCSNILQSYLQDLSGKVVASVYPCVLSLPFVQCHRPRPSLTL